MDMDNKCDWRTNKHIIDLDTQKDRFEYYRISITVSKTQDHFTLLDRAQTDGHGGELDHDEPPDGEGEGEPDGHRVDEDAEVHVEQKEVAPTCWKLQRKISIINGIIYFVDVT